jgi:cobalt-zinc-cadmium efflux system membrane fusion protein
MTVSKRRFFMKAAGTRLFLLSFGGVLLLSSMTVGCSENSGGQATTSPATTPVAEAALHGEWWCAEHGVPEEICAQCDSSLVASFKKKGDWCEEHNRPDSQCFICHPELKDKFATQYEAKYGNRPPEPSETGHDEHDHDGHEDQHKDGAHP